MKRLPCAHAWVLAVWAILILLSFMFVNGVQAETRQHAIQKRTVLPEVLTLDEVARLLRVSPKTVTRLARERRIPGRLIEGHWRFRRTAMLDWLESLNTVPRRTNRHQPTSSSEVSPKPTTPLRNGAIPRKLFEPPLSKNALLELTGRGPTDDASDGSSSSASLARKEPETIGEKPVEKSAEEAALRGQQVLLNPQELTLELDFSYARTDRGGLTVVPDPLGGLPFLGNFTGETDLFIWGFVARYGLPHDLLLVASLPLIHNRQKTLASVPGSTINDETRSTLTETGDLSLTLRHTTIREGVGHPQVILSLQTLVPTRKSSFGLGGSITLIKRIDPVSLFANVSYTHIFSREFKEVNRLQTENIFNIDYGFAFSINETLAISTSVLGTFTTRTTFDDSNLPSLPAIERFFLRSSLTALVGKGLFVEPFVTFSLNGGNSVTLGLNIPYTFDIAPYFAKVF